MFKVKSFIPVVVTDKKTFTNENNKKCRICGCVTTKNVNSTIKIDNVIYHKDCVTEYSDY